MGEIADLLASLRNGQGADCEIKPSLGQPIKVPTQIGLMKFEINPQLIGDLPP